MSDKHSHEGHDHNHDTPSPLPASSSTVLNADVKASAETILLVAGVDCSEEVAAIESTLRGTGHVREVKVSIISGKATIQHDGQVSEQDLIEYLKSAGLSARLESDQSDLGQGQKDQKLASVIASGVLTGVGLLVGWLLKNPLPFVVEIIFGLAIIAGAWFIVPKAFRTLKQKRFDMNVLMTVAVVGAVIIGEWSEAAAVTFLFALSELLESYSVSRARRAIESLMQLTPLTALVKRDGEITEVDLSEVATDETIVVRSGAKVPLDGTVITGSSAINQAPITGESLPVEKKIGDQIFAGTINGEGSLEARVTGKAGETTLASMIRLIEEAQSQKAPSERFVDTFAKYYTPAVMVLALLVCLIPGSITGDWSTWVYRSLVLLVIACPCALVISTPVSVVSGLTAMARRGVLIKGGAYLEILGKLRALAVDKTGTITRGLPEVTEVTTLTDQSAEEIVAIAAAIDTHSDHPIAVAIINYAKEQNISFESASDYQSQTGRGADGTLNGHHYFVGNHRYTHELGVCSDEIETWLHAIESNGLSVVVVGHKTHDDCAGEVLGIIAVGDTIREDAQAAIASLHAVGIEQVIMLSGDNQTTVNAIAEQAGIDEAKGDLLPDQKIENVRELLKKYEFVGMVGDGVNDAPAMASASLGIAMGAAGTDTAIETADMALMTDDLSKISEAIHLGRRALGIIKFNIIFSLAIKAIFLVLAFTGHTSLWLAILADTGATLLVIANALRLLSPSKISSQSSQ
ncbi:heavy metal translocating P-type ATPase [Roseibacillus persicicus]|uniref:heavy metal translocating P-type ATPase n=1 Tax=Roseibacillus persicicus TaxID=454148 RepID=UPI00280F1A07|nr:heavy metal translocating P-type ATPase [Roseibacillus persicicus]MDQ8190233.1 heavy metal translocating P-type ATPase [Roseibacillus persicicus]